MTGPWRGFVRQGLSGAGVCPGGVSGGDVFTEDVAEFGGDEPVDQVSGVREEDQKDNYLALIHPPQHCDLQWMQSVLR
jgi:hypothetical protein